MTSSQPNAWTEIRDQVGTDTLAWLTALTALIAITPDGWLRTVLCVAGAVVAARSVARTWPQPDGAATTETERESTDERVLVTQHR